MAWTGEHVGDVGEHVQTNLAICFARVYFIVSSVTRIPVILILKFVEE